MRRLAWIAPALLLWALKVGAVEASEPTSFPVMITPDRSVLLRLDLSLGDEKKRKKPEKNKLEGRRAIKKTVLPATVVEDVHAQGCLILRKGASASVEIMDASAPVKKGVPGFLQFKIVALEFAGSEMVEWEEGGSHCIVGKDLSDRGKKIGMFKRKGGPAVIRGDDPPIEFQLLAEEPPEAACGVGGDGAGEEKQAEGEQERPKRKILIPAEHCNRGG